MRDDVIANAVVAVRDTAVESVAMASCEVAALEGIGEVERGVDDDVQRGRFQRLEEALRQTDREAIAPPAFLDPSYLHAKETRFRPVIPIGSDGLAQLRFGRSVVDMARGIDIAIADPRGQRDRPAPASLHSDGVGLRPRRFAMRRRHHHGTVVEQVLVVSDEPHAERLLREERGKARTIDEKIALDPLPVLAQQRSDIAIFAYLDPLHLERAMSDPACDGPIAQESAELVGVEMVAVARREGEAGAGMRGMATLSEDGG